ncbi:hypothetical protein [Paenibacillus germinis]|nr:hypothetical protein [Paenibacillus germinis]
MSPVDQRSLAERDKVVNDYFFEGDKLRAKKYSIQSDIKKEKG